MISERRARLRHRDAPILNLRRRPGSPLSIVLASLLVTSAMVFGIGLAGKPSPALAGGPPISVSSRSSEFVAAQESMVPSGTYPSTSLGVCEIEPAQSTAPCASGFSGAPESSDLATLASSAHPPALYGQGMVYDPTLDKVVLFGGTNGSRTCCNSTWEYSSGQWTELTLTVQPSVRIWAAMAYDPKIAGDLLFGGYGGRPGDYFGDTWEFANGSWKNLSTIAGPSARYGASITYDSADHYLLLYGGYGSKGPLNDSWKFAGGKWTELSSGAAPGLREFAAMTYDSADGYVLLFGGCDVGGCPSNDTWTYSAGTWTKLSPTSSPPKRLWAGMTFDAESGYVLLFGGANSTTNPKAFDDSWSFLHGVWSKLTPKKSPTRAYQFGISYDAKLHYVILFGGDTTPSYSPLNTTWKFQAGTWTKIA